MAKEDVNIGSVLGLGVKVFLVYWLGAAISISIMNGIAQDRPRRAELLRVALNSSLRANALLLADIYEKSGCDAGRKSIADTATDGNDVLLASPSGELLCGSLHAEGLKPFLLSARSTSDTVAKRYSTFQVLALAVQSHSGRPYVVVLKSPYNSPLGFFGWMPGPATISTSTLVALTLTLLLIRPINRLRTTARSIATGNLDARVEWGSYRTDRPPRDAINGLIHDFNRMADQLQSLVAAQKTLLRDVSHELRSPLARLSVGLELARDEASKTDVDGHLQEHLDRIESEAAGINKLIGHLLSLSYMETIQEIDQPVNLSVGNLVEELLPDLLYEARGRNRTLTATLAGDCPICGDAGLLHRAIENIVRNAIRYTSEGGVVHIDVRRDGNMALLSVNDSGPGVPEPELDAILRPFYRVDKARQLSTGGFGVGLAIAERAIHLHKGKIAVTNRPQGGLCVKISLPLAEYAS